MKSFFLSLSFLFIFIKLSAQSEDHTAAIDLVKTFFDAMRSADAEAADSLFLSEATLNTIFRDKEGSHRLEKGEVAGFAESINKHEPGELDEKIWSYDVNVHHDLARVWTDYTFFYKGEKSHCGVNVFTLHRTKNAWKILDITDTRTRKNCQTEPTDISAEVNEVMNAWHKAAATADEDVFFGSMTAEGIYIGTDKTELWLRDEMAEWAQKYFERDSAWDFKTIERNVYANASGDTAWFDEKLDTWMGVCRSSGVLEKTSGAWKIAHYHLSVTVDNDLIQDFLKLGK